jgi:putative transcriptional regulator
MAKSMADKLKDWRSKHGLSQSQAATALGVPVRTLQEWEQGRRSPRGLAESALEAKLKGKP